MKTVLMSANNVNMLCIKNVLLNVKNVKKLDNLKKELMSVNYVNMLCVKNVRLKTNIYVNYVINTPVGNVEIHMKHKVVLNIKCLKLYIVQKDINVILHN